MTAWNLSPAWTALADIVAQQVTQEQGMTDEMFNLMMENLQYLYNNLSDADVRIGTVTTVTGAAGSSANAAITVSVVEGIPYLNFTFTIPKGDKGDAATVQVGTVTTLPEGSDVVIENIGDEHAAVLNFSIPRGNTGVGAEVVQVRENNTESVPSSDLFKKCTFAAVYTSLTDSRLTGLTTASTIADICLAMVDNSMLDANTAGYLNILPVGQTDANGKLTIFKINQFRISLTWSYQTSNAEPRIYFATYRSDSGFSGWCRYTLSYQSFSDLGLATPFYLGDIVNAMKDNSMGVFPVENHLTTFSIKTGEVSFPAGFGVLTIIRKSAGRIRIEFNQSLSAAGNILWFCDWDNANMLAQSWVPMSIPISTVMPLSSASASNSKVLGEKVVYDEFLKKKSIQYGYMVDAATSVSSHWGKVAQIDVSSMSVGDVNLDFFVTNNYYNKTHSGILRFAVRKESGVVTIATNRAELYWLTKFVSIAKEGFVAVINGLVVSLYVKPINRYGGWRFDLINASTTSGIDTSSYYTLYAVSNPTETALPANDGTVTSTVLSLEYGDSPAFTGQMTHNGQQFGIYPLYATEASTNYMKVASVYLNALGTGTSRVIFHGFLTVGGGTDEGDTVLSEIYFKFRSVGGVCNAQVYGYTAQKPIADALLGTWYYTVNPTTKYVDLYYKPLGGWRNACLTIMGVSKLATDTLSFKVDNLGNALPYDTGSTSAPATPSGGLDGYFAYTYYKQIANLSNSQIWTGAQTFANSPIVPMPETEMQAANKGYVDSNGSIKHPGITYLLFDAVAGDNVIKLTTGLLTHSYASAGYKLISISGTNPFTVNWGDGTSTTVSSAFGGFKVDAQNNPEQYIEVYIGTNCPVGEDSFRECKYLVNVIFAKGWAFTSIGARAFRGCSRLENITLPYTVSSIGSGCFYACVRLKDIYIPSLVTAISNDAFCNCQQLTRFTLHANITSVGTFAFAVCTNLRYIEFLGDAIPTVTSSSFNLIKISDIYAKTSTLADSAAAAITTGGGILLTNYRKLY